MTDAKARALIENDLDATVFVDAGAGSGKTQEMVERIVRLVANERAKLTSIAAITFTEAAAAELRDRVRLRLELAHAAEADYTAFDTIQRDRCALALEQIDAAPIQTLHSFAQRILALYPLEAGLPPRFEPMDEVESSLAFGREWVRFRDRLFGDGLGSPAVAEAVQRAMALGLQERQLRAVALKLHGAWHRLRGWSPEPAAAPAIDLSALVASLEEALDLSRGVTTADKAAAIMIERRDSYEKLIALGAELSQDPSGANVALRDRALHCLLETPKLALPGNVGSGRHWGKDRLEAVRDCLTAAQQERDRLVAELRRASLATLLGPLREFVLQYAGRRRAEGRLEFHDLLVMARDLLAANRAVRAAVGKRYARLLIDEFQDTDPLQIEIAVLIAGWEDPRTDWEQVTVPAGRLFFVGDPKQSIYRFRYADIALYERAKLRFGHDAGRRADLTRNFRSASPIIRFANEVFDRLFQEDRPHPALARAIQAEFQPLEADRDGPGVDARARVRVFGKPVPATADVWRENEAADLAAAIARLVDDGTEVYDRDAENWRLARLSDVAILIPSRTSLPAIERALAENGIPSRIDARSLLFGTQEVRDLLNILAAVDDPSDAVAVVAALRTPGLGCTDRDLFEWRKAGWTPPGRDAALDRGWDYTFDPLVEAPCPPEAERVRQAMLRLRAFHAERWWIEPSDMVERVVRELGLLQVAFASRRPRDWWQRIRFVHDHARQFANSGGRSLREFIQWMRDQEEEDALAVETAVAQGDDDAVRIMTIHAAKGLEFNIVFVCGLGTTGQNRPEEVLWQPTVRRGAAPVEVRVGPARSAFATAGFDGLAEYEVAMERLERDRLLYVAATRARDHLYVSRYFDASKGSHRGRHDAYHCSLAECLDSALAECPDAWEGHDPGPPRRLERAATADATFEDSREACLEWQRQRAAAVSLLGHLPSISATAVAHAGEPVPEEPTDDGVEREEPPWRRGRAGTSIGRAVHAVLQTIDLATGNGLEAAARAQAAAEGLPGHREVEAHVRQALGAPSVREAVASGRFWREVPVGVVVEGVTLEGFIDLLYETDAGFVVVDYKTDAVRSATEADEKAERYRLQGAAYALALSRALERPVARVTFVFLGQGKDVYERSIAGLEAAMGEAERRVAELAPASG